MKKGSEDKNITTNSPNGNKQIFINYFNVNENDTGPNRDLENTVFLMNFELMNLCDNKNLQIANISNNINGNITTTHITANTIINAIILKINFTLRPIIISEAALNARIG